MEVLQQYNRLNYQRQYTFPCNMRPYSVASSIKQEIRRKIKIGGRDVNVKDSGKLYFLELNLNDNENGQIL